jgi:hypothetical protein
VKVSTSGDNFLLSTLTVTIADESPAPSSDESPPPSSDE